MKPITETDLVDYLGGELSAEEAHRVEAAVADDSALRAELEELRELMAEIKSAEEPTLSAAADARFETMLAAAMEQQGQATEMTTVRSLPPRKLYIRLFAAAAAILLIFAAGWYVGGAEDRATARQLAATRTLMLDLMKDSRPSARIQATTVSFDLPAADPQTIADLGHMLRTDESANVRLAALDALRRFPNEPAVREILLSAMNESPPDVVRFELIETLVRFNEKRVLPYLQDMIDADSLPRPVRDAAQMASFKLI
ncbi:HEAT repeat domain-containing protein [Neolewinella agarilytica]|uniref:HEAT repeat domain-containing protein n=1 Tax=Neolewinella agarilytica TaxID=478744 RepID=UPI002355FB11|nr:HEAT repeat domain-containing protein [Neolewinella agarilytica]